MSHPTPSQDKTAATDAVKPSNFLRQIIEHDLAAGTYAQRKWGGSPGDAAHHAKGEPDPAKIRTRFPPEPNGYLHIGHAKSICLNFGLARDYGGVCHMRFDDTNPEKEDTEYVNSILDAVQWLGFNWEANGQNHLFQASDYFDFMYRAAEYLIEAGHAYVDEQTPEQMRVNRGDFGKPGVDSPFRKHTAAENLTRFQQMRDGLYPDGAMVLRAKIDMASPNINMRDPAIYRIRRATHHNTGDKWCIYPMYTFAHPIEDALEQITHSICTLEFEDQRPFYDWLMARLSETVTLPDGRVIGGLLSQPAPKQYEFARLNLTYVITSKRKLAQLVYDHRVNGWDDPRMPTIVGLRRRGYTPASLQLFAERIGVTKSDSWIDYATLEGCLREDLELKAHRGFAVLNPVKLVLTNWDEVMGAGHLEPCTQPALPHPPEGTEPPPARHFTIGKEVWIDREDFEEVPPKGYKRLFPGNKVRLKGGYVIECIGCTKDASGVITEVLATVVPDTKSGTPGSETVKVKAAITWVGVADGVNAEVRLYDRLFSDAQPDAGGKDFLECLNPNSLKVITAIVEPSLANALPGQNFQFERHGYFVADRVDHVQGLKPVFNLATTLKDAWSNLPSEIGEGETFVDLSYLLKKIQIANAPMLSPDHDPAIKMFHESTPFIEPPLRIIKKGGDTSPFVVIRAPGAVGKSALAKYFAYKKKMPLWDLGKQLLGDHVFRGAISDAFGDKNFSDVMEAISKGSIPIAIDALDEAEIRSGGNRIENVLLQIAKKVCHSNKHTIFLFARTDTADFIQNYLSELEILKSEVPVYEISFFDQNKALQLVRISTDREIVGDKILKTIIEKIELAMATAFGIDKKTRWENNNFKSFMGYAPVLLAVTSLINQEKNPKKLEEELSSSEWISDSKGSQFLYRLIILLLEREQLKLVNSVQNMPEIKDQDITVNWLQLYTPTEQLTRLAADRFANIPGYSTDAVDALLPQVRKHYDRAVADFYPQHPFLRGSEFANPAFRDHLLAWAMKNNEFTEFANDFLEKGEFVPTPLLFSLYSEMPGKGTTAHAGHLIESFISAERGDKSDTQAIITETAPSIVNLSLWVSTGKGFSEHHSLDLDISKDGLILGSRLRNISVTISGNVTLDGTMRPTEMSNVDISCHTLIFNGPELNIRNKSEADNVSLLVDKISTTSRPFLINCKDKEKLTIASPERIAHPWNAYQNINEQPTEQQSEAHQVAIDNLIRIVRWFRKDGKVQFARYKDLIDFIVVGADEGRRSMLQFMLKKGLISLNGAIYVMTSAKANQHGISWSHLRNEPPNQALLAFVNEFLASQS